MISPLRIGAQRAHAAHFEADAGPLGGVLGHHLAGREDAVEIVVGLQQDAGAELLGRRAETSQHGRRQSEGAVRGMGVVFADVLQPLFGSSMWKAVAAAIA
jgi:hypothetical protein